MKQKIKRHYRSAVSVLLSVCMLISCMTVGLIGTEAARVTGDETIAAQAVDDETVGANEKYLWIGTSDNSLSYVGQLSVTGHRLSKGTYYINVTSGTSNWYTDYEWWENSNDSAGTPKVDVTGANSITFDGINNRYVGGLHPYYLRMKVETAGDYNFTYDSTNRKLTITGGTEPGEAVWTALGDSKELFGTTWSKTAAENEMVKSDDSYVLTKTNVSLSAGTIQYKVIKNHSYDEDQYPASGNASQTVSNAGVYNVTITYSPNASSNKLTMTLTHAAKHKLTVPGVAGAAVKATYDGRTAQEGEDLTDIPVGATVNITVTPDTIGKTCTAVTPDPTATVTGSGKNWNLIMPDADAAFSVTLGDVALKRVYYNNYYTRYAMVTAYAQYDSGEEPLGSGVTMTKIANTNTWYVEVPGDVDKITFRSGSGATTGEMIIPWSEYNNKPKYTGVLAEDPSLTATKPGYWGEYNNRTNEYTVSKGLTLNDSNLFTGIKATFYDYYTDNEVDNGWLNIANNEYSGGTDWKWNPYKKLNSALSKYAADYSVSRPLYFGNLNTADINTYGNSGFDAKATIEAYTGWNLNANNSGALTTPHNAVMALSGTTLAQSNIHYYKSGATNENGHEMALFDEDFLSGENNQHKPIAAILRSSAFPVRKTTVASGYNQIFLDNTSLTWYDESLGNALTAHFWDSSNTSDYIDVVMRPVNQSNSHLFVVDKVDPKYDKVRFDRVNSGNGNRSNMTKDYDVPANNNSSCRLYLWDHLDDNKAQGDWRTCDSAINATGGAEYYEFDSSGGKDNAYIESIDTTNKTANLEYYDDQKVRSSSKAQGFFPYDKAQASATGTTAHDLGFGMKLEIPFTINQNGTVDGTVGGTPQVFNFSGDDDLWVFIDNKLVLDLGGAHAKTTGSIDFSDCSVTAVLTQMSDGVSTTRNGGFASWFDNSSANAANTPHTMTIYYTERGMYDSNLKFGFSFHPIPNQFKAEKKVRTKGDKDLGILNINSGFFQDNGETEGAAASNKSTDLSTREGRFISKFEESFQSEQFTFTQTYTNAETPATGTALPYTLHEQDGALTSKTVTPDSNKTMVYTLKNDEIAHFVKQFVKGDTFTLKETAADSNKYRYTPQLVVYDDARLDDNGNEYKFVSGNPENDGEYSYNSTTGVYTFKFNETVASGLDNTNIRARFENHMKYHDLTLKKVVDDPSDTDSEFTFEFKFDFDFKNVKNYIAYPLDVTVLNPNGTVDESDGKSKLSVKDATHEAGRITIKAGQTITLPQIPENAKIQITEIIDNDTGNYTYDSTSVKYDNGTDVENPETIDNGVQFVMGSRGINAVVSNSKRKLQITHSLHPDSLGDASCYLKVEVQKNSDSSVEKTYGNTTTYAEPVDVDADYLRYDSTNKLVITLTTTVTDPTSYMMEHFYEKLGSTINLLSGLGSLFDLDIHDTAPTPYATITVPISGLFDSTTHAQKYTILPFYSKVIDAGKDVKIYKKITSGTSSKTYTMFIKTIRSLDDDNPADYSGTYTIKNVSDDAVVGTANQTYSSSGVSITPEQYILLEKVRLDTKLQITEKELSSDYARAFHYDYTSVKVGSADAKTTKDSGGITASTDPKKIDNGVRFTVSDKTNVDIYNKAWTYRILYKYPGYLSRYYTGAHIVQTYTMTGDFKDEDFDETTGRMTIGRTTSGSSAETYPCAMFKGYDDAEYPYKTTEDTVKNFITSQAPYEDNFMTSMTWNPNLNPNDTSKERTTIEYFPLIDGQHVNIETSADTNPNDTIHVYFRLPYNFDALNKSEGTGMDPTYNDQGKIVKKVPTNYRVTTQYAHWFTKNGLFTEEENSKWIQAPAEIYDTDGTKYVFRHWSMVSVGKDLKTNEPQNVRLHEKKDEYEYKRCYNNKFNMTLYQDTYVEPVYILESNDPTYGNDASLSPAERETKDTTQVKYGGAIINFLENSRNQWNNGGGSLYSSSYENIPGRLNLGDRVFSDFLLSFNYNDLMLKSPLGKYRYWTEKDPETGEDVEKKEFVPYLCKNNEIYHEYGFLLEVVDDIKDENQDEKIDSMDILDQEDYRNKYNSKAEGTNPEAYDQMVAAVNFLDADTAVSSDGPFIVKSTKKASGLDNKNEVEYSSSLPLINHTSGESTGRNLKVFRAYAYLKDYNLSSANKSDYTWNGEAISDNEFAALSSSSHEGKVLQISKPVYFTIFNIASVANGTPFDDKGGQS